MVTRSTTLCSHWRVVDSDGKTSISGLQAPLISMVALN